MQVLAVIGAEAIARIHRNSQDEKAKHIGLNNATWLNRSSMVRYIWLAYRTNRFTGERVGLPQACVVDDFGNLQQVAFVSASIRDIAPGVQNPH